MEDEVVFLTRKVVNSVNFSILRQETFVKKPANKNNQFSKTKTSISGGPIEITFTIFYQNHVLNFSLRVYGGLLGVRFEYSSFFMFKYRCA